MIYMKFCWFFFSQCFDMAKLKDTGSVALCAKIACRLTKSASLAMNFDYEPGDGKQNICDDSSRKSRKGGMRR